MILDTVWSNFNVDDIQIYSDHLRQLTEDIIQLQRFGKFSYTVLDYKSYWKKHNQYLFYYKKIWLNWRKNWNIKSIFKQVGMTNVGVVKMFPKK